MVESATPEKIGELNRKLILDFIRKNGPVSRADIHRSLDMSFPTVSANVKRLIDGNYIFESGDGDNSMGRKSTLLSFNTTRAYIVGIDLGRSQIRLMLADLCGNEVGYIKEDSGSNWADMAGQLCKMIDAAVAGANLKNPRISYICVGVPGVPDMQTGRLLAAPYIESLDLNEIHNTLKERYDAAVLIDNSVNYGAIGEKWHGVARGYKDIVYINYGVGIGGALILNDELYRGFNNAAGEIGYMVPGNHYLRDSYCNQGALETLVSGDRIRRILQDLGLGADIRDAVGSMLSDSGQGIEEIRNLVDYIGIALINVVSVFNAEAVVIGGGLGDSLGELFIPHWQKMLENHVPFVPRLMTSGLHNRANVLGAVAVAVRQTNDNDIE